eukprot:8161439-Alexandrium_andersonii.AAC.1
MVGEPGTESLSLSLSSSMGSAPPRSTRLNAIPARDASAGHPPRGAGSTSTTGASKKGSRPTGSGGEGGCGRGCVTVWPPEGS